VRFRSRISEINFEYSSLGNWSTIASASFRVTDIGSWSVLGFIDKNIHYGEIILKGTSKYSFLGQTRVKRYFAFPFKISIAILVSMQIFPGILLNPFAILFDNSF